MGRIRFFGAILSISYILAEKLVIIGNGHQKRKGKCTTKAKFNLFYVHITIEMVKVCGKSLTNCISQIKAVIIWIEADVTR